MPIGADSVITLFIGFTLRIIHL